MRWLSKENELATKLGDPNSIRGTHIVRTESCRLSSDLLTCAVACAFAHTYMYLQRQFLKMAHWFFFKEIPLETPDLRNQKNSYL